ncbi:hypothetical protein QAD02_015682 [Eretmocerus hayati]|uniref:Uncharacterized protein n=1 Tax=Eretmocerus hayati TaxID=131215 RepID=A0ACC2P909_9HYME|nr:hypothetical protein QAD02_015682 [Eretmocerus hayati]
MEESSYHDRESLIDSSARRLSESRPMVYKPHTGFSGRASIDKPTLQKTVLNSYLKETLKISEFVPRSDERGRSVEKTLSGAKRNRDSVGRESSILQWQPKSFQDKQSTPVFKDQSDSTSQAKSYSPDVKRLSHSSIHNQFKDEPQQHVENAIDRNEVREPPKCANVNFQSQKMNDLVINDKITTIHQKVQVDPTNSALRHSTSNASLGMMETPMKMPQGSSRPNPCNSHRNIFETPQNKAGDDFSKNPIQTPATIFSHWSQHHMAQTPVQGKILANKELMQTPSDQRHYSKHETPRFYSAENKSIRRPLAETMFSGPPPAGHLPRLQEVSNESLSPQTPKESPTEKGIESEQKHAMSVPVTIHESKENRNPNPCDVTKKDSQSLEQSKLSALDKRYMTSHLDSKVNTNCSNNMYYNNPQVPIAVPSHEVNHQLRERHTVPQPIKNIVRSPNSHQSVSSNSRECQNSQKAKTEVRESGIITQPSKLESQESKSSHQPVKQESRGSHQPIVNQTNSTSSVMKELSLKKPKVITVNNVNYLKLGVLGHGMSCEVIKVQDLSTSEFRAIKCVNLSQMDRDAAQGCLQEICLLDKLKAPCVVNMYSFEIKEPWVFVVMEIGDTDLSSLLKSMLLEKRQIPLTMALYYWTEMLTAVKHIHDNGVIHSDLKPANFLLVRGRLKLIDFGIASSVSGDMTSVVKNNTVGTLNYISPEALMDVNGGNDSPNHHTKFKISYKSDVWSLGCILYSLVYGKTPFHNVRQQWAKINAITDPKFKISFPKMSGTEQVPLILIDVMHKCLQRDPKVRPTVDNLLSVQYLQNNFSPIVIPKIPDNIISKIRNCLDESEWETFKESLDVRRK